MVNASRITPLQDSLWSATAGPEPEYSAADSGAEADVAIVGGGYLGLSTALHLARQGVRVVVLEAHRPGQGASGRNSGFVVPSFVTALGPERVQRMLDGDRGERLCRLVGESGTFVFRLIREYDIRCEASQSGWLQPAHCRARIRLLETRKAAWARYGRSLEMLGQQHTEQLTGVRSYHAALLDRSGGHLNPLAFTFGLARAAMDEGACIRVNSPVSTLERDGRRWRIRYGSGSLLAETVLLATNALDAALAPGMARSLIPVTVYQMATQPLDEANRALILPENHCVSDTRRDIFAFRWTPDGRLLTGGVALPRSGASSVYDSLRRRLHAMVSLSGRCEVAYGWNGRIAITRNLLPMLSELNPGVFAAVGCCGRGLALSTVLGQELAEFLRTGDPQAVSIPAGPPAPLPAHAILRHLPNLLLPWSRWRDRMEAG